MAKEERKKIIFVLYIGIVQMTVGHHIQKNAVLWCAYWWYWAQTTWVKLRGILFCNGKRAINESAKRRPTTRTHPLKEFKLEFNDIRF